MKSKVGSRSTRRRLTAKQTGHMLGSLGVPGRPKDDFYHTPEIATEKLLEVEEFRSVIWEPACGSGGIGKVLQAEGHRVHATDLYPRGYGSKRPQDFLKTLPPPLVNSIVTNPPYSLAFEFVEHATDAMRKRDGKVAMLLRLAWLEGKKRKALFKKTHLSRVYVFSSRLPRMHRPNWTGKKSSSMIAFAWFVWDYTKRHRGTQIKWL